MNKSATPHRNRFWFPDKSEATLAHSALPCNQTLVQIDVKHLRRARNLSIAAAATVNAGDPGFHGAANQWHASCLQSSRLLPSARRLLPFCNTA
jgi:hypothetical protein